MKTKEDIVKNWLPRYTGEQLDSFGKYILLTNFSNYVRMFAEWTVQQLQELINQCNAAQPMVLHYQFWNGRQQRQR